MKIITFKVVISILFHIHQKIYRKINYLPRVKVGMVAF